ncbi:MAG: hypothetical protein WCQ00_04165 [bacterium]
MNETTHTSNDTTTAVKTGGFDVKKLEEFIDKVDSMKKQDKMDLSSDQDLSIAIMNLVSIEEHFFFTGAKTGKNEYYDLIDTVREMRKELLKRIIKDYEGEVWCISKHLMAASYRLMEVGTKQLSQGHKEDAYNMFNKSYELYSLFWGLNMKMISTADIKKIDEGQITKDDKNEKKEGLTAKLGDLVRRAINCCIE